MLQERIAMVFAKTEADSLMLDILSSGWGTSCVIGVAASGHEISTRPFQVSFISSKCLYSFDCHAYLNPPASSLRFLFGNTARHRTRLEGDCFWWLQVANRRSKISRVCHERAATN